MKNLFYLKVLVLMLVFSKVINAQSFYGFDLNPGSVASSPFRLTVVNNKLLLAAADTVLGYPHLFATDGTISGTAKISDVVVMDRPLYVYNNKLYFQGYDASTGTELWSSDGTLTSTSMVADINPGNSSGLSYTYFIMNNGLLCFFANNGTDMGLWKSDGTQGGTQLVAYVNPYPYLISNSNKIYFNASELTHGNELWISDGTGGGTYMLKDIFPGSDVSNVKFFQTYNGKVYFSASDGVHMDQLWATDGTEPGTQMVAELTPPGNPGSMGAAPSELTVFNSKLYFRANDNIHGVQVWSTDGTLQGTQMLKIINNPTGCNPNHLTVLGNNLYFVANNGSQGDELWVTDGTEAGTHIVKDIAPGPNTGSNPHLLTEYHNKLYFVANDGNTGDQLWVSDGTESGTHILQPSNIGIAQYLSSTNCMTVYNDRLYFNAHYDNKGEELWAFDDTPSSVNDIETKSIQVQIFPNPTAKELHVNINTAVNSTYNVELFNVFGQKVLQLNEKSNAFVLNTESLAKGLYLICISNNYFYSASQFIKK